MPTATQCTLEEEIERVKSLVLDVLRDAGGPMDSCDVIDQVLEHHRVREGLFYHAIWGLIGDGRAMLTDQRQLAVGGESS